MPASRSRCPVRLAQRLLAEREMAMREGARSSPSSACPRRGLAQRLGALAAKASTGSSEWESQGLLRLVYGGGHT